MIAFIDLYIGEKTYMKNLPWYVCLIERAKLMSGIHVLSAKSVNKVFYFSIPSVELCLKHYTRTGVMTYTAAECGVCFQRNWSEPQALSFYFLVKTQAWKDGTCPPRPWPCEEAPMTPRGVLGFSDVTVRWIACLTNCSFPWEFLHFHFSL